MGAPKCLAFPAVIEPMNHRARYMRRCHRGLGWTTANCAGGMVCYPLRLQQKLWFSRLSAAALSLKDIWDQALSGKSFSDNLDNPPPPLMHQISRRSRPRLRARRGRNGVVRYRRRVSFGQSLTFRSVRRAAGTGITAIALKVGRSSFPWGAIPTSRSRAPGRDATPRGSCLKRASILKHRSEPVIPMPSA
jgi:hypothetical protein